MVALDVTETEHPGSSQVDSYVVRGGKNNGAIYPTANFEPLPIVAAVEHVSLALGTLSDAYTMTILRLVKEEHSHLPRRCQDAYRWGGLRSRRDSARSECPTARRGGMIVIMSTVFLALRQRSRR